MTTLDFIRKHSRWDLSKLRMVDSFEGFRPLEGASNPSMWSMSGRPDGQDGWINATFVFQIDEGGPRWFFAQEFHPDGTPATPILGYREERNVCDRCGEPLRNEGIELWHRDAEPHFKGRLPCLGHSFCSTRCADAAGGAK